MDQKITSLSKRGKDKVQRLPYSIRILLQNMLRHHNGFSIPDDHDETLAERNPEATDQDIPFKPSRILMQDFTGVPAVVDITSLRSEAIRQGLDGENINPAIPVDLIIDHSVQVDYFGTE